MPAIRNDVMVGLTLNHRNDLTTAMLKRVLDYDPMTGVFVWKVWPRRNIRPGTVAGGVPTKGYFYLRIRGFLYPLHRLAWLYTHERWPNGDIDHIDGNRQNNAIGNLREATRSQNVSNKEAGRLSSSGFRGVYRSSHNTGWSARIVHQGNYKHLGVFLTKEEAYTAYCAAAVELRGEFAHESIKRAHLSFAGA